MQKPKSAALLTATAKQIPGGIPGLMPGMPGVMPFPAKAFSQAKPKLQAMVPPPPQQTAAARIKLLEAAIEADPNDIGSWDARMREAVQEGKAEPIFERAVKQFPFAARIWAAYAEWSETQDPSLALAVYSRCLQQVPNLDLWLSFLNFSKRHQNLEEVLKNYQRAIDMLGSDWRAAPIWTDYFALLKHAYNVQLKKENPEAELQGKLLAEDPNPIETVRRTIITPGPTKDAPRTASANISDEEFLRVSEVLKLDIEFIRKVFQRCASASHGAMDKLWIGYEQFEKSLGNPALAAKLLADHMPRYVRGKAAAKELASLGFGIDHYAVAIPLRPKTAETQKKLMAKWMEVINYERTNPLHLDREELTARVTLTFQQASMSCAYFPELWHDFASWLDLGGQQEQATETLRRAVERYLPKELTLRLLLAHRYELGEAPLPPAKLEAADDEYRKLMDDVPRPCPLALINFLAYVRRQRGPNDFRDTFLEATENSPHCTWEVYAFAALTEYHVYGSAEAAARVFRLGMERYGDREPSLLAAYVNFLIGSNDLRSARAELSKGVLERLQAGVRDRIANREDSRTRESLKFLWQKWARLERYFGDADAVRRASSFRDEEYRNLQRDLEVDAEAVQQTPISLGLATTMEEIEEGFRFQHLIPRSAKNVSTAAPTAAAASSDKLQLEDEAISSATKEHSTLGNAVSAIGMSTHIARPDVSKMLAFRPALDVIGSRKRGLDGAVERSANLHKGEEAQLPVTVPKCLQDLLAVLPARSLKGAKPDVDYLLTVLQTVNIPPVPVKELDTFRYDSLRLLKREEDSAFIKDEDGDGGVFSSRPTAYRDRLQAKRQKVMGE
eukprot:TRINITY_DN48484_c0_g1_i1.p1 TRINITY_DN48484_c0_g1~~TRINITY_DN48484_c0_g1_i1.p1  ORF type:complete len:846 (+),score=196.37 TRINITY_DN48484_c0_g1_i1:101-2638(+)